MPTHKIQSVRLRSGPLLRRLRLASVHVDTAGRRWQASALCRDAAQAERLLAELPVVAGLARREVADATVAHLAGTGDPAQVAAPV